VAVKGLFFEIFYFFHLLRWAGQWSVSISGCFLCSIWKKCNNHREEHLVQMAASHFCKAMHFTQTNMNKLSQNVTEPKILRVLIRMRSVKLHANQHMLDIY